MVKSYRKQNRKLKRYNNQRYKKGFSKPGSVNKLYHNKIPRTLQIATRRNNSQMLRFVKNMTFGVVPGEFTENIFLTIRANSIYDIMFNGGAQNQPGTWNAQDVEDYGTTVNFVNADGFDEWRNRFQHFTVIGSKIQASYEPIDYQRQVDGSSARAPATLYINLEGSGGAISPNKACKDVVALPYTKRATVIQDPGHTGKRLYQFYSARKFEGVKDPLDNSNLRGRMGTGSYPNETAFYHVGIVPTIANVLGGSTTTKIPQGLMRIKVEYIVKLTEPTLTNQVSA